MKGAFLALCLAMAAMPAVAQPYPDRPIKFVVADGSGSVSDLRARQIGQKLAEAIGQPVVIENRLGGSMIIAAETAARAPADGYTLLMGNVVMHCLNPLLFRSIPYRPDDDFLPVTMISSGPLVLVVHPAVAATSLEELLALAKMQPGKLSYGVIGVGSPAHIVMEQIKAIRGAALEFVPYKSAGQYLQDLVAGHLHVTLSYWSVVGPHVKAGRLRALGVTAAQRLAVAPDVPTFTEAGLPIEAWGWQGVMVPAGTPRPIVSRLHAEIVRVLELPEIRSAIIDTGAEVGGNTPEAFASFIRADRARWKRAVADANIPQIER